MCSKRISSHSGSGGIHYERNLLVCLSIGVMSSLSSDPSAKTHLAYHYDSKLLTQETVVSAVYGFSSLDEASKSLFKTGTDAHHVVVTESTIFHPQGGGQPSDEGSITDGKVYFVVEAARMDGGNDGRVLHFGRFSSSASIPEGEYVAPESTFVPGATVTQQVDGEKRLLYSRLHTAGHVLGAAVRAVVGPSIPGFDELKASHFPGTAACEFRGLIAGTWQGPIQQRVDDYLAAKMPVEIDWWGREDFEREGLVRLIPEGWDEAGKLRVVKIVGAEVYPCGGTHVETTDLCGETKVKRIARAKGISRVSYTVA